MWRCSEWVWWVSVGGPKIVWGRRRVVPTDGRKRPAPSVQLAGTIDPRRLWSGHGLWAGLRTRGDESTELTPPRGEACECGKSQRKRNTDTKQKHKQKHTRKNTHTLGWSGRGAVGIQAGGREDGRTDGAPTQCAAPPAVPIKRDPPPIVIRSRARAAAAPSPKPQRLAHLFYVIMS